MLALSNAIIIFGTHSNAESGLWAWPSESEWIQADDDPNEPGCEEYKDGHYIFYHRNYFFNHLDI